MVLLPRGLISEPLLYIPRDEEFDSTSQRQPLGYESN